MIRKKVHFCLLQPILFQILLPHPVSVSSPSAAPTFVVAFLAWKCIWNFQSSLAVTSISVYPLMLSTRSVGLHSIIQFWESKSGFNFASWSEWCCLVWNCLWKCFWCKWNPKASYWLEEILLWMLLNWMIDPWDMLTIVDTLMGICQLCTQ